MSQEDNSDDVEASLDAQENGEQDQNELEIDEENEDDEEFGSDQENEFEE